MGVILEYISGIMALEESIQQDVMSAIQQLMSVSESANQKEGRLGLSNGIGDDSVIDRQLKEAWDEVHRLTLENEELSQKYHDIQQKVSLFSALFCL